MRRTIESNVREIVSKMKEHPTYIFDNWATCNIRLDELRQEQFPVVIYVLPASGTMVAGKQMLRDEPRCQIAFLNSTSFDYDGEENEDIVEGCKDMAREFVTLVNSSGMFEPLDGEIPYSVVYEKTDANLTGVIIEVTLKEIYGTQYCRIEQEWKQR